MSVDLKDEVNKPISSLSYQIMLVFGWWYFAAYIIAEIVLLIFKKLYIPYPIGNFLSEIALLFFLCGIEGIRNFLGKKGNLTERMLSVVLSLLFTIPVATGVAYFLWWQTYVLMVDYIMSIILLILISLQSLFAGVTLIAFSREAVK